MKLHYTKYQENYKNYILDCLNDEDDLINKNLSREEKIKYLFNKFDSEYGWKIGRTKNDSRQNVIAEWLGGLAINIPYLYCDIIGLAKDMGSVEFILSSVQEDRICQNYWNFMAYMILLLEKEIKEVA
tara:strand:- start:902 stop:1285 length:384 start_codon:yes stop_codon:yes gene_type:complete